MQTLIRRPSEHDQQMTPPKRESSSPDAAHIQHVLEEVLASPPFCHTQQCQSLLRYIVKHSLTKEEHLLRERVIGAEVFGRRPDYETGEDPIVRIRAAEVRKRLAQFYQSVSETAHAPDVQIDIPSGSYRASFRWRESMRDSHEQTGTAATPAVPDAAEPQTLTVPSSPVLSLAESHPHLAALPRRKSLPAALWWLAGLVAVAACVFVGLRVADSAQMQMFHSFWQPWTSSSKPVIIAVGSNAVYRFSDQFTDNYARSHNLEAQGMEFFVPLEPNEIIRGSDLDPAPNSFVALGDVAAVSAVVAALTKQGQSFQERFPNDISFAELRDDPTMLVGGFNNPMTLELTKYLPFVLRARNEIDDTRSGRRWILHASEDSHDTEDYAIITRMAQRNGDAPILSVAGMGQYGTVAAAGFICSPASINQLARQLPKGWASRNLQAVLHVRVVDFKAVSTDVVAVRTW